MSVLQRNDHRWRSADTVFRMVFAFVLLPCVVLAAAVLTHSAMGAGPDSRLYLSIADNFLSTGHFIQTARKAGYVVPFGTPLILTILRFLRFDFKMILAFQYVLLGGSCWFLSLAERNLGGRGWISPALFTMSLVRTRVLYDTIYVECYFLFCLCVIVWLLTAKQLSAKKRILLLNVFGFLAFSIRTVLLVFYVPILVYTLFSAFRGKLRASAAVWCLLIPCLLMSLNAWNNHRETGHWILTDNYSGSDLYLANNPGTKPAYFTTWIMDDFLTEEYWQIDRDPSLDFTQKNQKYNALARQWIAENPGTFVKNLLIRFHLLFILYWKFLMLLGFVCGVCYCAAFSPHKRLSAICLALNLLLGLVTCVGNAMGRYSLPLWPLTSIHLACGFHALAARVFRKAGSDAG